MHKPRLLLASIAVLAAILVQPGEMSSIDTLARLQTTRSLWTSAPPVAPGGPAALVGRDGKLYCWYGIGQSLLMLPADIVAVESVRLIGRFREPPWWLLGEERIVSYITSTLVCLLTVLVCFSFLRLLSFSNGQSVAGACALLVGTTFLHYTQNPQENNYLLLLTLTGFWLQYAWFRKRCIRTLFWGSMALGANLLTRLTTVLDLLAAGLFIALCIWQGEGEKQEKRQRLVEYARVAVPCYGLFFLLDRVYQYYRFGSFFTTYLGLFGKQMLGKIPYIYDYPPEWPWSTPFLQGFLGPLLTPEKSIFLFDPLIIVTLLLALSVWNKWSVELKAFAIAATLLLIGYICFYAKYYDWSGDAAWGDRYVTTPVQMLAMIAVPLLLRYRAELKRWIFQVGKLLVAVSVVIQAASVFFWSSLEVRQVRGFHHPTFIVGLRFANIAAYLLGTTERWGLANQYTKMGPLYKLTTPYFFPFLAMKQGVATPAKEHLLIALWLCLLGTLLALLWRIGSVISQDTEDPA